MSVRERHDQTNTSYFCTFTCNRWLNLFSLTDSYDLIYNWFDIIKEARYQILGYVVMPNHVHYIIHTPADVSQLNKRTGSGKRFMAYEIVKRLKASKFESILEQLSQDVLPSDRRIGKLHNVFRDSFDAREIFNENMIIQKLEYMHHNPVSGKWKLVDDFTRYLHSSALFYETGIHSIYPVTHYKDVWG